MSSPLPLTPEIVLEAVRHWSVEERLMLLDELLQSLRSSDGAGDRRRPTLSHALGLAATEGPAPDDATVAAWLEERRRAKYG